RWPMINHHSIGRVSWLPGWIFLCCLGTILFLAEEAPGQGTLTPTPRQLYEKAQARYAPLESYITRLTRHEWVDGKRTEEILILYFRKHPWSVRFKWLAGAGQGREV